jgi:uncharacterized protein with ATP-grasp and redox domains
VRSYPECVGCIIGQGLRTAKIATDDERLHEQVVREIVNRLQEFDFSLAPAVNSMIAYDTVAAVTGNPDPFRAKKREHNDIALAMEQELEQIVESAPDKLHAALQLSAAGNVIDMGVMRSFDIKDAVQQVLEQGFAADDYTEFRESLEGADEVLFVGDNAGEIVFDKPLVRALSEHAHVVYAVKSAPIINDATMEDAEYTGMTKIATVVVTGTSAIGAPPELVSDEFREILDRSDLIVAKGQGNFETLDVLPQDIFFILKAKCSVVARELGVKLNEVGIVSNRKRLKRKRAQ